MSQQLMSDQIDQLATALAKAQGEFDTAGKNQKNPFFKSNYADLESVVEASRPALSKYGLSVVQSPSIVGENGSSCLITILMHASGQWIKSVAEYKPVKNDIQSLSSYNTYLKRMCYTSLVGVVVGENDDDGEGAVVRNGSYNQTQEAANVEPTIDSYQLQDIRNTLKGYPDSAFRVLKRLKIENFSEIKRKDFSDVIKWVHSLIAVETKKD